MGALIVFVNLGRVQELRKEVRHFHFPFGVGNCILQKIPNSSQSTAAKYSTQLLATGLNFRGKGNVRKVRYNI